MCSVASLGGAEASVLGGSGALRGVVSQEKGAWRGRRGRRLAWEVLCSRIGDTGEEAGQGRQGSQGLANVQTRRDVPFVVRSRRLSFRL